MWIRSQDRKTLVNASNLHILSEAYEGFNIYSGIYVLGHYSTEEKAIKLMDMIEEAIIYCEAMMNIDTIFFDERKIVFQMPKDAKDYEDEV